MRPRHRRFVTLIVSLMLVATACSGGGDEEAAPTSASEGTQGTTATSAGTTTTVTTMPVVVGTTLPSVPLAYQVRTATLGDCDWPEVYPADAEPIVVTINDIDARSDLGALAADLPAWEILTSSDEMTDAGMLAFAHRTVRLYGTNLIGGAYLFEDETAAAAHLEAIEATFSDAAVMGPITEAGEGYTEVETPSPGAFSLTDGVPPDQGYDGFFSARISQPAQERATYVIDGFAWHNGDTVGFLRTAYPATDGSRSWAAVVAAGEMIGRGGGPVFGFFKQPLTTVPDLGLLLEAVLQVGDTFDGDTYDQPLGGQFFSLDAIEFSIPSRIDLVNSSSSLRRRNSTGSSSREAIRSRISGRSLATTS